jgi:hypothetical protein
MAWKLSGDLVEACSCNVLCPCWFGVQDLMVMDRGWCDSTLVFRIRDGRSDDVDLGGRTVIMGVDFPGPTLFDGNATARLFVDEGTSPDQRRALETIFQGKRGGPMEVIGGLVSRWLPTKPAPIEVKEHGDVLTVKVGDVGEIASQVLKTESGKVMTLQNSGFSEVLNFDDRTLTVAPSKGTRWSDPDMPRAFETKSGARAKWAWNGA